MSSRRTGVTEHDDWPSLLAAAIVGQRGDKAYVRGLGFCNWNEITNTWELVSPNGGNFGQAEAYGVYTSFNAKPKFWGWNIVEGSPADGPNTIATAWHRGRFAAGTDHTFGIQGGVGGECWMEIAIPRIPIAARARAGSWTRVCELGTYGAWVPLTEPIPTWTTATLTNGWVNYGYGYNNAAYRKIGKIVTLRGMVKSGTMGVSIMTLPTGYRPVASCILTTLSNNVIGRVDINSAGVVVALVGTNNWISLDGISFSID